MKKFKLIKEYPGSPKLGTVIKEEDCSSLFNIAPVGDIANHYAHENYLIQYPEFWEEIPERDFELLALTPKGDSCAHVKLCEDGKYRRTDGLDHKGFTYKEAIDQYNKGIVFIKAVKRLSDGIVFYVGDVIKKPKSCYTKHLPIKRYAVEQVIKKIEFDSNRFSDGDIVLLTEQNLYIEFKDAELIKGHQPKYLIPSLSKEGGFKVFFTKKDFDNYISW